MSVRILMGDARERLRGLPDESVHCIVTSPPYYGLRDYGVEGQIGLERTPDAYVAELVAVFREARRVLRNDGTLFLNLGDSYHGGGRGGGGSFASERRAWRAVPCGTSGKEPEGSLDRDCLCGSLCDGCRRAYRLGKSHSGIQRVPTLEASTSSPTRAHKGSALGHPPTSGFARRAVRNVAATHGPSLEPHRGAAPVPVAPVSTMIGCDGQPLASHSEASTRGAECQLCGCSLGDCGQACAGSSACICDTAPQSDASSRHTSDKSSSGLAYPSFTTASLKPKDLIGIPWMVAFALRAGGWYLRSDNIWHKPNPMPESVEDRCTKAHEYVFMFSKAARYWYDAKAIAEPFSTDPKENYPARARITGRGTQDAANTRGDDRDKSGGFPPRGETRNRRSVWTIATEPSTIAHFAMMPTALAELCIKAGCPVGGTVLDPFGGAGTTGLVADRLGRSAVLIELNPTNAAITERRIQAEAGLFADVRSEQLEAAE